MARSCTCKICSKKITTDIAFKVVKGNINYYYCSQQEYEDYIDEKIKKEDCFITVAKILEEPVITPMMKKEINELKKFYDYIVIEKTFKEFESSIRWFLQNKSDCSEYAKTRYIITIVKNNINSTYKKYIEEQKQIKKLFIKSENNNIDMEIINIENSQEKISKSNDISEFLD
jgi:hypothetical protein